MPNEEDLGDWIMILVVQGMRCEEKFRSKNTKWTAAFLNYFSQQQQYDRPDIGIKSSTNMPGRQCGQIGLFLKGLGDKF